MQQSRIESQFAVELQSLIYLHLRRLQQKNLRSDFELKMLIGQRNQTLCPIPISGGT
jgi:hypothetical protein